MQFAVEVEQRSVHEHTQTQRLGRIGIVAGGENHGDAVILRDIETELRVTLTGCFAPEERDRK